MFYKILIITTLTLSSYLNANLLKKVDTFSATFTQNITNSSNSTIVYKGKIFTKNKNKILWKYENPIQKDVYILNNRVIVNEPELEQAIYTTLNSENDILKVLQNAKQISNNTYKAKIQSIEYTIIDKKDNIEIRYKDELENSVVVIFENIDQNSPIKDEFFNFLPPKNYDIIRK